MTIKIVKLMWEEKILLTGQFAPVTLLSRGCLHANCPQWDDPDKPCIPCEPCAQGLVQLNVSEEK